MVYRAVYENDVDDNSNPSPLIIYDDDDNYKPDSVIESSKEEVAE